ncbi:DUF6680 family protein [Ralstonia solanacearum]|uniref:DUF6680 family protein n=1 Tax=Ralstonia solanacearum TaxID=305 RepID=UPI000B27F4E3|nr:DUF6680 family protein [Ralstonia solanacearum]
MTSAEWVIAFATLVGPVLAVQAQKWLERSRARDDKKIWVFSQLMATRTIAARISADHVRALNMIDLVFYGRVVSGKSHRTDSEQAVMNAWRSYHDHLSDPANGPPANPDVVYAARDELFLNLLEAMAKDLKFDFDRVTLKKGGYTPQAHGDLAAQQLQLLKDADEVFAGRRAIRVEPVLPQQGG